MILKALKQELGPKTVFEATRTDKSKKKNGEGKAWRSNIKDKIQRVEDLSNELKVKIMD